MKIPLENKRERAWNVLKRNARDQCTLTHTKLTLTIRGVQKKTIPDHSPSTKLANVHKSDNHSALARMGRRTLSSSTRGGAEGQRHAGGNVESAPSVCKWLSPSSVCNDSSSGNSQNRAHTHVFTCSVVLQEWKTGKTAMLRQ